MLKQLFQGICSSSDSSKSNNSATSCRIGLYVSLYTLIVTYLVFSMINFFLEDGVDFSYRMLYKTLLTFTAFYTRIVMLHVYHVVIQCIYDPSSME